MKLKNNYWLLRHGQTIYQTSKKDWVYPFFLVKPPVKLTKKGERQIEKAAKFLKKEGIDLLFSSDFFRTQQTAKIVAPELGLKIKLDKRLRDVALGTYHGERKEEFYRDFPYGSKKLFYQRPAGGENWRDAKKRILSFLQETDKKYKGKIILIISHGDPLWLLEGAVKKWSIEKLLKIKTDDEGIKTGELRIL